jgi:hypothetical protein
MPAESRRLGDFDPDLRRRLKSEGTEARLNVSKDGWKIAAIDEIDFRAMIDLAITDLRRVAVQVDSMAPTGRKPCPRATETVAPPSRHLTSSEVRAHARSSRSPL